ncbi:MAG: hypothetical protein HUJ51_03145 [Eggerthellaceae bacterium]|nr:hypothetical protein [Eggerthellaceae bacterium]
MALHIKADQEYSLALSADVSLIAYGNSIDCAQRLFNTGTSKTDSGVVSIPVSPYNIVTADGKVIIDAQGGSVI